MNGWLAVANISCSVKARLIFFRSIISFLDNTKTKADQVSFKLDYATRGNNTWVWYKDKERIKQGQ